MISKVPIRQARLGVRGPGGELLINMIAVMGHEVMHALDYRRSGLSVSFFDLSYTIEKLLKGYRGTVTEMNGHAMGATILEILRKYPDLPDLLEAGEDKVLQKYRGIREEIRKLYYDNLKIQKKEHVRPEPFPPTAPW